MDHAAARQSMVDNQLKPNQITDPLVIAAMAMLPRERFVPKDIAGVAYVDEDLPLGNGRCLVEPLVVARLVQAAAIESGERALVTGDATGYVSAVVAEIASEVVVVEPDPDVAMAIRSVGADLGLERVRVVDGAFAAGSPTDAPFAAILFAGGIAEVPSAVLDQLSDGGRLVAVLVEDDGLGRGIVLTRSGDIISRQVVFDASTPFLPGMAPTPAFVF